MIRKTVLRNKWLVLLGNVSQSCIRRWGLLLAFHKSFQALFLELWLADLPVPVSFFVTALLNKMFAQCFTVNHRGKPGPLPQALLGRFHGLSWYFAVSPGDKQRRSPCFLSGVCYPTHSSATPPAQETFFRPGAWSRANSNRDLPACPLSVLTPAGVAFSPAASIRAPGSS